MYFILIFSLNLMVIMIRVIEYHNNNNYYNLINNSIILIYVTNLPLYFWFISTKWRCLDIWTWVC